MSYFDTLPRNFKDVRIIEDDWISTAEFLEAAEGVVKLFDLFGSTAFAVVQSDMNGNIAKIRAKEKELGPMGETLQQIVLSEANDKRKTATQGLLWLTRGLEFTAVAMTLSTNNPTQELSESFTDAYKKTLSQYHSFVVRLVFKLAMMACPSRSTFYEKLGNPTDVVASQLKQWLEALDKIVRIIQDFLASRNYAKGL